MRPYSELVVSIRDAVRKKAQDVPKFKNEGNGAIRILAYPYCEKADKWFGGLSVFGSIYEPLVGRYIPVGYTDIVDYEYTFGITPGGSRVMTGIWGGVEQKVDCYAYSALKIADCSRSQDEGRGLMSGLVTDDEYRREDNGYGPHPGALCFEVTLEQPSLSGPRTTDFCLLYVCVSGAESHEDLECTKASIEVIESFFKNNSDALNTFLVKTHEF